MSGMRNTTKREQGCWRSTLAVLAMAHVTCAMASTASTNHVANKTKGHNWVRVSHYPSSMILPRSPAQLTSYHNTLH